MRAAVPDGHRSVEIADVDEPVATPGTILVDVRAFSPNRGETFLLSSPVDGWRPGKDVAGVVATEGGRLPMGTRVVAHAPSAAWAERALVPEASVVVLPDDVSFEVAAALPLAGLTALRLLQTAGSLLGRTLLITGASGGVGHYVTELAVAAGAEVTALTGSFEGGSRLRELGATIVTDVEQATGPFDVAPIIQFHYQRSPTQDGHDLGTLVRLTKSGRLHPEIGVVWPWARLPEAIAAIRDRTLRGNAVLTITSSRQ